MTSSGQGNGVLPIVVELGLTAIAFTVSLGWPSFGSSFFTRIEPSFKSLARKPGWAVAIVGMAGLLFRLAILPVCPIPNPSVPDDFSFLLSADTFSHGRLVNQTPAMWTHFESIHITMQPTYMSIYFPAQGLVLAAGKVLLGNPWYGLLITNALMCAAICWMLQAWLPPTWAFLGGALAVMHLGLFSYWINTYHAGAIAALGGALVLGSMPRLMKSASVLHGVLMVIGIVILALSRPFEGLLLCLPVLLALGRWMVSPRNRTAPGLIMRRAAFPVVLFIGAVAWLGYYDYRAFGSPLTLPYTVGRATYATAPYFIWQKPRPEPAYRHAVMRDYYRDTESKISQESRSPSGYLYMKLRLAYLAVFFFTGAALVPPLFMVRHVFMDRRIRFLVLCVLVLMGGMAVEIFLLPHYLAPFTAAFYAIGLQAMRHLRLWRFEGKPTGLALVRFMVTICVVMTGLRLFAGPLHLALPEYPPAAWNFTWYGPDHFGTERVHVEKSLSQLPGNHLAIVRYSSIHNPWNEWVYNSAEIDTSKIIWAREMDVADNLELTRYYRDRKVWLVEPDVTPARITEYPKGDKTAGDRRFQELPNGVGSRP
jgi:hypothetical protein